jgi:hypothetical protein
MSRTKSRRDGSPSPDDAVHPPEEGAGAGNVERHIGAENAATKHTNLAMSKDDSFDAPAPRGRKESGQSTMGRIVTA